MVFLAASFTVVKFLQNPRFKHPVVKWGDAKFTVSSFSYSYVEDFKRVHQVRILPTKLFDIATDCNCLLALYKHGFMTMKLHSFSLLFQVLVGFIQ